MLAPQVLRQLLEEVGVFDVEPVGSRLMRDILYAIPDHIVHNVCVDVLRICKVSDFGLLNVGGLVVKETEWRVGRILQFSKSSISLAYSLWSIDLLSLVINSIL